MKVILHNHWQGPSFILPLRDKKTGKPLLDKERKPKLLTFPRGVVVELTKTQEPLVRDLIGNALAIAKDNLPDPIATRKFAAGVANEKIEFNAKVDVKKPKHRFEEILEHQKTALDAELAAAESAKSKSKKVEAEETQEATDDSSSETADEETADDKAETG